MNNYSQPGAPGRARVGVIGVTGYAGLELARLLLGHPGVTLAGVFTSGREGAGPRALAERAPAFAGLTALQCVPLSVVAVRAVALDLIFLATPHEVSLAWVPRLWRETAARLVDLSGAIHLRNA